eukprot:g72120.t1
MDLSQWPAKWPSPSSPSEPLGLVTVAHNSSARLFRASYSFQAIESQGRIVSPTVVSDCIAAARMVLEWLAALISDTINSDRD